MLIREENGADFRPFTLFSLILRLGYRIVDLFSNRLSLAVPAHPKKGSALFDQWIIGWKQDTLSACDDASHCIGTDASYKGQSIASIAIIVQRRQRIIYQHARPCAANSSFDGELHALLDAVEYVETSLQGCILIICDNEAALKASIDNSRHSGFAVSLQICKLLHRWFSRSTRNSLQLRWFPGHMGFDLNELADSLAGASLPCVNPPPVITTASRRRAQMGTAVSDWRSMIVPTLHDRRIQLKVKRNVMKPQLWGRKGRQFYDLVGNDISLFGRFVRLISGHAPIGSYRQRFFPHQTTLCPTDGQFQDIQHVTVQCPKYSAKFPSFAHFLFSNKNAKKSVEFLKQNSAAVSFEDQPLDIDLPP